MEIADAAHPDDTAQVSKWQAFACWFYRLNGVHEPFDHENNLVTSHIRFLNPSNLAIFRLFAGVFTLVVLGIEFSWSVQDKQGKAFPTYFTHLSYFGISVNCFIAGYLGLVFTSSVKFLQSAVPGASPSVSNDDEIPPWHPPVERNNYNNAHHLLKKCAPWLQLAYIVLVATVRTFPLHVTIIFWFFLSTQDAFTDHRLVFSNINTHILNSVFALFEILLTNSPELPLLLMFSCASVFSLYLGVIYLSHFMIGHNFYPYPFLDPKPPSSVLIVLMYIGANVVLYMTIFILVHYLVKFRIWLVNKYRGKQITDLELDEVVNVHPCAALQVQ